MIEISLAPDTGDSCAGDSMMVIRDALLSQLQKDRLRQEIILAELGKIECALAMRSADAGQENAAPDECNVQESSEVSNLP
jgi:hypothetical protein